MIRPVDHPLLRYLLLVLSSLLAASCPRAPRTPNEVPDLRYTLSLLRSPAIALKITLAASGSPDGVTRFVLGAGWGASDHPERDLRDVSVTDDAGTRLPVERASGQGPDHDLTTWTVHHAPGRRLAVTYVVGTSGELTIDQASYHRSIVHDHLVHLVGSNVFVVPEHLDASTQRRVGLAWEGFTEVGWTFASSFGTEPAATLPVSLDELLDAVFIASDELAVTTRRLGAGTVAVATVGRWAFRPGELADLVAAIVGAERAFFADAGAPFYLVSAIPVGKPGAGLFSGSSITDSFVMFLSPDTSLTGVSGLWLRGTLAHEHFHTWIGGLVHVEDADEWSTKWFTEGFTVFYGWRILVRAGLITLEDHLMRLNRRVADYVMSPVRELPNAQIGADTFWTDADAKNLPYARGDMAAILIDREIRRVSRDRRSLDDVMRQLVATARHGGTVSTDTLLAAIVTATSPAFAATLRAAIVDGHLLAVTPDLFEPCLSGELKQTARFEMGFDVERSLAAKRVLGLRAASAASEAGLRDGQELTGWRFGGDDPDQEVTLQIRDAGAPRDIVYHPRGEVRALPVFAIHDRAACGAVL
ncbi:MAG: hypothetical protein H6Q90_6858 [Deltaproteobacteria bacterium]|nr:hypothetical protein [Deltaproteobacteria bacterium]